ncbi:CaiB/BaiF CoA transferase family protein [Zhongshania aquimaris]|uniref:CoA transferase n=1 Tax=Zhongshania aquimaris TaxID=2857107 RepID=A0ABS6VNN3_9GAMM|nr:CoA transferase [Zhongshania aquimaris]MBW2939916.1 CoA transferase [Zhongshania aquimaris]
MSAPLEGIRVIDCSLLAPGATAAHLADLGAEVIKIEAPGGDYVRELTWPIIEGSSLMHHEVSRGKKSLVLDLRQEDGVRIFKELVAKSDVVIEAMRPGALARRGLSYENLKLIKPDLVFCCISGYGMTGPYRDMPAHGIAFDSWAGLVKPEYDDEGFCNIPEHPSVGMHSAPVYAGMAICAALLRSKRTGQGAQLDIGQSDGAAYIDRLRSETWKAYERPQSEVSGNKSDNHERREPGTAGMRHGVRYQYYESRDGHVLFMASEQEFWRNFCDGVGHSELFEKWPGKQYGDHAVGNRELQLLLRNIFKTRSTQEWMQFASEYNTAIAPVNTPKSLLADPHFQTRFPLLNAKEHIADMLPFPVHFCDEDLPIPSKAPTAGEHSGEVLKSILNYSEEKISALTESKIIT